MQGGDRGGSSSSASWSPVSGESQLSSCPQSQSLDPARCWLPSLHTAPRVSLAAAYGPYLAEHSQLDMAVHAQAGMHTHAAGMS